MKEKIEYSKVFPLLPKDFDLLEEYVYFGILAFYDNVFKKIKENRENIIINQEVFNEMEKNSNAMEILEKNKIINKEFLEGAHLYVKDRLKFDPEFKKKLESMSNDFKIEFYNYAVKIFFDRYYEIYRACPICADVKDDMIFNDKDRRWYCPNCYKKTTKK